MKRSLLLGIRMSWNLMVVNSSFDLLMSVYISPIVVGFGIENIQ